MSRHIALLSAELESDFLIFAGDRDSETSDIALRREAALMKEDDLEIDDDEEGMEEGGGVTGEPGK